MRTRRPWVRGSTAARGERAGSREQGAGRGVHLGGLRGHLDFVDGLEGLGDGIARALEDCGRHLGLGHDCMTEVPGQLGGASGDTALVDGDGSCGHVGFHRFQQRLRRRQLQHMYSTPKQTRRRSFLLERLDKPTRHWVELTWLDHMPITHQIHT